MTIFSKIVRGEIPCYKIAENEHYFAFLDINPVARGHTLVIPKMEVDYVFDLPDETIAGLAHFAKPIAKAIDAATGCIRTGIIVEGLEVPHAHIHLIPMYPDRKGFSLGKSLSLTSDEMSEIAASIREKLNPSIL
jgi:histidine triad (HIT) family protein